MEVTDSWCSIRVLMSSVGISPSMSNLFGPGALTNSFLEPTKNWRGQRTNYPGPDIKSMTVNSRARRRLPRGKPHVLERSGEARAERNALVVERRYIMYAF